MLASAITALVGLAFWAVATGLPAAEVGRASVILSTATLLSVLASQNVGLVISRFIAGAGTRSRKLVLGGYGIAVVVALVLGSGFALFFASDELFHSWEERALFPLVCVVLALFVLQDWVLTGLRASIWVPLEQLLFALVKLGLLVVFIQLLPDNGIVLSWVLPAGVAVLIVSPIIVRRVLPRRAPPSADVVPLPGRPALLKIFLGEYATGAMVVIVPMLLPLIVLAHLGTTANAYYALPWMLSEAFNMLLWNIGSSYMVEVAHDSPKAAVLLRRTAKLSVLVAVPGVPFLLFVAPWLLGLLKDPSYAIEGGGVMRLLACAIPFLIITSLYLSTARLRQQMGRVVAVQLGATVITITLATLLVDRMGINGVALAYLIAEIVSALVVVIPLIRVFRETAPLVSPADADTVQLPAVPRI
ncbi:lipopolysaccharide biosynthesis protein [Pseudonocardia sp. GCM10023141]|uniref:lipopolysaccharide biosynthesis protein n=1 Tax=Pseudonocardia sp. GCM10023141 TaxID=3252653 RepID=UPI00361F4FCB